MFEHPAAKTMGASRLSPTTDLAHPASGDPRQSVKTRKSKRATVIRIGSRQRAGAGQRNRATRSTIGPGAPRQGFIIGGCGVIPRIPMSLRRGGSHLGNHNVARNRVYCYLHNLTTVRTQTSMHTSGICTRLRCTRRGRTHLMLLITEIPLVSCPWCRNRFLRQNRLRRVYRVVILDGIRHGQSSRAIVNGVDCYHWTLDRCIPRQQHATRIQLPESAKHLHSLHPVRMPTVRATVSRAVVMVQNIPRLASKRQRRTAHIRKRQLSFRLQRFRFRLRGATVKLINGILVKHKAVCRNLRRFATTTDNRYRPCFYRLHTRFPLRFRHRVRIVVGTV